MSSAALLREIEKLPYGSLNKLVPKVLELRASKHPRRPSSRERELLAKITAGPPQPLLAEHRSLMETRQRSGLSASGHERLVELADELESFNLRWLRWVSELAQLRGMTAAALLRSLQLPARCHA